MENRQNTEFSILLLITRPQKCKKRSGLLPLRFPVLLVTEEVQMTDIPTSYRMIRRFLNIAKLIFGLVLLALEIVKRFPLTASSLASSLVHRTYPESTLR